MAYIAPNGTIQLMRLIPLTSDYKNTFYFSTPLEQEAYFSNFTNQALTFTNQMYLKPYKNTVRLQSDSDDEILTCNYMRFRNTGFSNMWFYAFIKTFERININVVEFTYEIDVMQTYYINSFYRLGDCYVDREHAKRDNAGDNIVPEPVDISETVLDNESTILSQANTHYYVLMIGLLTISSNASTNPVFTRSKATGYYSGYRYLIFTDASTLQSWINNATITDGEIRGLFGNNDWTIEGCFAVPSSMIYSSQLEDGVYLANVDAKADTLSFSKPQYINGYEPRNKKLLTHPYCFCRINGVSSENDYKYENFYNSEQGDIGPQFRYICTLNPEPSVTIMPMSYEGSDRPELATVVSNFPVVNIHQSGLLGGIGRHIGQIGKSALQSIAKILSVATLSSITSTNAIYSKIAKPAISGMSEGIQATNNPLEIDSSKNLSGHSPSDISGVIVDNRWKVTFERIAIKRELAERIDTFFDKYGYAVKKVKTPELQASGMYRTNWVYLKTDGCILLNPLMPSDDADKIRSIYDNGITYWKPSAFGNYSLSNDIVT